MKKRKKNGPSPLALLYFPQHDLGARFRLRRWDLACDWNPSVSKVVRERGLTLQDRTIVYQNRRDQPGKRLDFCIFAAAGKT